MNYAHLRKSTDQVQQEERNQHFVGIWFHDKSSLSDDTHDSMLTRLKATFEYIRVFDDIYPFTSYLFGEQLVANVVVIISSILHGPSMCELVRKQINKEENKFRQLYVLLFEKTNQCFDYPVCTTTDELFSKIEIAVKSLSQSTSSTEPPALAAEKTNDGSRERKMLPPLGVMKLPVKQCSIRHLSNESLRFIQFQTLIEILLSMKHDEPQAKDDMLSHCREYYHKNCSQLCDIEDFKDRYTAEEAILHYTNDGFCFRMVNRALRSEDIEHIYSFRLFITDLHNQLAIRATQRQQIEENIVVYRGKQLPNAILQQLKDNIQGLISMNGFLSTTKNELAAKAFSGDDSKRNNYASIIFELHLQKPINYKGKPFADISPDENDINYEQEVLFSVGTVWRIDGVQKKDYLWYIKLTNCTDLDDDICKHITDLSNECTFLSIGHLLQELGENDKAEEFYWRMLENEPDVKDKDRGVLHFRIGELRAKKGDYRGALSAFNKAIPHFPSSNTTSTVTSSTTTLMTNASRSNFRLTIYFNIGIIHRRNNNREKAQEAWDNALKAGGTHEDLAKVHECIGDLAHARGKYEEVTVHRQEARKLIEQSSASEEDKCELKRKSEDAIQLSDRIAATLTSKRQRSS